MATRLTHDHPKFKAFQQLCALAEDLKIDIQFLGVRTLVRIDGEEFDIEDIEDDYEGLAEFPPKFEVKLVKGRI